MNTDERANRLAQHLKATADAHFVYETNELNGVYDEQWSEWYAAYLLAHDWNTACGREWNQATLAEELRRCHADHRADAPEMPWIEFYAARFANL